MATFFCPNCFAKIPETIQVYPHCQTNIAQYLQNTPYVDRLIHALHHPESEARMCSIIALGHLATPSATTPLIDLINNTVNRFNQPMAERCRPRCTSD
jgi:hypothetical protein